MPFTKSSSDICFSVHHPALDFIQEGICVDDSEVTWVWGSMFKGARIENTIKKIKNELVTLDNCYMAILHVLKNLWSQSRSF